MTALAAIERRQAERAALLARAGEFAAGIDPALGVEAVVVFGSVARGDFNLWSDIDVLVVADGFAEGLLARWEQLGERPPRVELHPWTPREWRRRRAGRDPLVADAIEHGVWLVGAEGALGGP